MTSLLKREPAAVGAVIAALYAAVTMVHGAVTGTGAFDPDTVVAAFYAVYNFVVRGQVESLENQRLRHETTVNV